jgi:putative two-component system response regulator
MGVFATALPPRPLSNDTAAVQDRPTNGRILVVEDEPEIRRLVEQYLQWLDYEVETAENVAAAEATLARSTFDLVLTDLRLPDASGLDLTLYVKKHTPGTRMILMSAHADASSAAAAMDRGVDYLLLKPFDPADLRSRIEQSFARRWAEQEADRERRIMQARLLNQEARDQSWLRRAAHALASAVEAKDRYTAGHVSRVTGYAMEMAEELGGIDLARFRLACGLHDVGKIGVPDAVLNRPARLTDEEYAMVVEHPAVGAKILEPLIEDELVIGAVRWHHERWDGRGYPDGLAGEDIPLMARVLAVADTLDAMTSSRAYRRAQPWGAAVAEVRRCAGTQFDPAVVAAFNRALPRLHRLHVEFAREVA